MKESTKYDLQFYYGELMQELNDCKDYFRENRIKKKMKAIEVLLDIDFLY
jgi:DNA replication protein DnaC